MHRVPTSGDANRSLDVRLLRFAWQQLDERVLVMLVAEHEEALRRVSDHLTKPRVRSHILRAQLIEHRLQHDNIHHSIILEHIHLLQ